MAAPRFDEAALAAYGRFRRETVRQFQFLTTPSIRGGVGIEVETSKDDPYPDAASMMQDVREHNRLKVYATGGQGNEHPLLTNDENDMFRAVHDAFGHAATGRGFDRHGEEAAWIKHAHMFSSLARRAMTTETRGQNSALIFFYGGRQFPEQKVALLPEEFSDVRNFTLRADDD